MVELKPVFVFVCLCVCVQRERERGLHVRIRDVIQEGTQYNADIVKMNNTHQTQLSQHCSAESDTEENK